MFLSNTVSKQLSLLIECRFSVQVIQLCVVLISLSLMGNVPVSTWIMYSRLCSFVFIYCQNLRIFWFRLTIYVNTTFLVMSTRDYLTDFYKKICLKIRFSQWFKMTYVWIQLYYTRFEEEEVYSPSILPSETNIFVIFSSIIKDDSHLIFGVPP